MFFVTNSTCEKAAIDIASSVIKANPSSVLRRQWFAKILQLWIAWLKCSKPFRCSTSKLFDALKSNRKLNNQSAYPFSVAPERKTRHRFFELINGEFKSYCVQVQHLEHRQKQKKFNLFM